MASRDILGKSPAVKSLIKMIERVSPSKTNVLVIGDSGTGKELVARMLHDAGPLKTKPFIPVNCGAIPETLIESEMFGHKKGSFTGAVADKMGLFEAANGGTLFLDEVGELPMTMQVKLLRAIQDRTIRKVGSNDDVKVDVRIIAATNRDLEAGVKKGTFREDLFYRLNVILIRTPPLRERDGDIRVLAEAFLKKFSDRLKRDIQGFDPRVMAALESYSWPGNIRELENVVERLVTLSNGEKVEFEHLPPQLQIAAPDSAKPAPLPKLPPAEFAAGPMELGVVLDTVAGYYVGEAWRTSGHSVEKSAALLGLAADEVERHLARLGLK